MDIAVAVNVSFPKICASRTHHDDRNGLNRLFLLLACFLSGAFCCLCWGSFCFFFCVEGGGSTVLPFDPSRPHRDPHILASGVAFGATLRPIVPVGERGRALNIQRRVLSLKRAVKTRPLNLGPHLRGGGCACIKAQIVAKTGLHSPRLRSRSALRASASMRDSSRPLRFPAIWGILCPARRSADRGWYQWRP